VEILQEQQALILVLSLAAAALVAWSTGANDVANAVGAPVGAGAVTLGQALLLAAIFEMAGALVAGAEVAETLQQDLLDPALLERPDYLVLGMVSASLAAGIWLTLASAWGWPVSSTHSIIGGMVGFAAVALGAAAVDWPSLLWISVGWLLTPLLGGLLSAVLMRSIRHLILNARNPVGAGRRWGPVYLFFATWLIVLILAPGEPVWVSGELRLLAPLAAVAPALLVAGLGYMLMRRRGEVPEPERDCAFRQVESGFRPLLVMTACAMAFAHGSNDVANAMAPLMTIREVMGGASQVNTSPVPGWMLALGGLGMVLGLATLGFRVVRTMGRRIAPLTASRAFAASLSAAAVVVGASASGLPVSTTHVVVGAIAGVGYAPGLGGINLRTVGSILSAWLLTIPIAAGLAVLCFEVLKSLL
jgi:PiT family inorganic phosphate transporter